MQKPATSWLPVLAFALSSTTAGGQWLPLTDTPIRYFRSTSVVQEHQVALKDGDDIGASRPEFLDIPAD